MSIGERITSLRKRSDLSQTQLAALMNVSRQAISKWENDQTSPDTLNLIKLTEVLDSNIEFLATGQEKTEHFDAEPITITKEVVKEVIVEKPVEVEIEIPVIKRVEVEKVVEKIVEVEKPVICRRTRIRYKDHPMHMLLLGSGCMICGFLLGLLL